NNENLELGDAVLSYIASRITSNIRELEGALIRVTAFANLNRQPVDESLAVMVLKDFITDTDGEDITPTLIMGQTADYFSVSIDALCSADRSRVLVNALQTAMYLCRELTELSLPKIGQLFGGRDHTTVMHANRKIREQMAEKRSTFNQVTELTNRIKQKARTGGACPYPRSPRRFPPEHRPRRAMAVLRHAHAPHMACCGMPTSPDPAPLWHATHRTSRTMPPGPRFRDRDAMHSCGQVCGLPWTAQTCQWTDRPRPVDGERADDTHPLPAASSPRPVRTAPHTRTTTLTCTNDGSPQCPHDR